MNWLKQVVSRRREYRDLSEEMAEHLQEKIEDLMATGMSHKDASAAARREFGNTLLLEEHSREVWQWATFDAILRDAKYAFRQLRGNPGFTLVFLLTLSIAIGANTAVFSVVNAMLLRPLPYPEPEQLAALMRHTSQDKDRHIITAEDTSVDGETWELVRDHVPSVLAAVYSYGSGGVNLQTANAVRYVHNQRISAGYFEVLGIQPLLGRTFTSEEDRPGGPKVAILSFELWRTTFDSDRNILGKSIALKGEPQIVVGVMPAGIHTTALADIWTPLQPNRSGEGGGENYDVVMRLAQGATWAQVDAQLAPLRPGSFRQFIKDYSGQEYLVSRPLQQSLAKPVRTPMLILMSAVAFILLIACANLAGLLLVRIARRTNELATRLALGATHAAILRQLMIEPLTLTFMGGLAGVALAIAGLRFFSQLLPPDMVPLGGLSIDARVLGFALLASIITSVLIGILPVLEIRRVELRSSMTANSAGGGSHPGRRRTRQVLIAAEVTLTVVLLAGAGLLLRTLIHLQTLPPGFDASNVMSAQVSLDDARYHDAAAFRRLLQQSTASMKRIPGVQSAAVALSLPFERGLNDGFALVDGPEAGQGHMSSASYVTPEFFQVLRVPLLAGRAFTDNDTFDSQPVVVVNVSFARAFFHSDNVVGRSIRLGKSNVLIVGLVSDVTKRPGLFGSSPLATEVTYYFPAAQMSQNGLALIHTWFQPSWIVRTSGPVTGLTESMQKAMAEIDPALPFAGFHPLSDLQTLALRQQRFEGLLLGILASLALLLSLIGVYGLVSSTVQERTREIGIRMALGSTVPRAILEIGSSGIAAVGAGLVLGLVLFALSVQVIQSELHGVKAYDPLTFAAVLALLLLTASLAAFTPAQRIARIDPALTLRAE